MEETQKLLSCWHKLEYLTPVELDLKKIVELHEGKEPWNYIQGHSNKKKTVSYVIYLGVFYADQMTDFVKTFFNDSTKNESEGKKTGLFTASISIDKTGKYIKNSFGISALPYALAQLKAGKLSDDNWSYKFEKIIKDLEFEFEYIFGSQSKFVKKG